MLDSLASLASTVTDTIAALLPSHHQTLRQSRRDGLLHAQYWPLRFYDLRRLLTGAVLCPALPLFPPAAAMPPRTSNRLVPATPRVISPSPTPPGLSGQDSYFGPTTRSAARRRLAASSTTPTIPEPSDLESDPELRRARVRSRSPKKARTAAASLTPSRPAPRSRSSRTKPKDISSSSTPAIPPDKTATEEEEVLDNGAVVTPNGHLAPPSSSGSITTNKPTSWSWRDFSRSPSPLGLIPVHRHFRILIHKHEVPRKILHVSIGFLVYWLYVSGTQTSAVTPWLMGGLIPIATVDFLRHQYAPLNSLYVGYLGALMRESEYSGYNGVIFYLLGAWTVLHFFPKDVGVVAVMLLSWCDCAASTFGRLYGRYTPRIRKGKSLAGTTAAFLVGVATAAWFWGVLAPVTGPFPGDESHPFMFRGVLSLPGPVRELLHMSPSSSPAPGTISGPLALGVLSVWSGFVAAASEVVDLFGWDDNLTIPVLSGAGIWGFLKVFG
ncbi:diacylglycerol kinase (CTP) [Microdochium nivale]|nr:diacylglycerol kinase (CTP) [Microdochium nivale]